MHRCGILKNQFLAYSWFSRPARMSRSTRRAPAPMQDQTLPPSFEIFATSYFSFQYVASTLSSSFLVSFPVWLLWYWTWVHVPDFVCILRNGSVAGEFPRTRNVQNGLARPLVGIGI